MVRVIPAGTHKWDGGSRAGLGRSYAAGVSGKVGDPDCRGSDPLGRDYYMAVETGRGFADPHPGASHRSVTVRCGYKLTRWKDRRISGRNPTRF